MNLCSFIRPAAVALGTSLTFALAGSASAAVLYQENFEDDVLEPNSEVQNGTVAGGIASFDDTNTGQKAAFNVVQGFAAEVMTFSFETRAPMTGSDNELLLRAGVGTGSDMLGSGDAVIDLIFHRDLGNRGGFLNNGNESLFAVVNNKSTPLVFNSPIDNSEVTLQGFQYVAFVKDNASGVFGAGPKGIEDFEGTTGPRPIERFSIGNASNANLGTHAIDNVGVVDAVSFETVVPEPSALALLGLGGLLGLRRRRSA